MSGNLGQARDEHDLLAKLRCANCDGPLVLENEHQARCGSCGRVYDRVDGIWRMLTAEQLEYYASFLETYPAQRSLEGWERDADYFLRLPDVDQDDPASTVWRVRRRSLRIVERAIKERVPGANCAWALDLGAGNCWLTRRLSAMGLHTVALDLNVVGCDSLLGGQLYIDHDGRWFDRVQGTMDSLPFVDAAFDICTVSAALYYASIEGTIRAVYRVLKPGGTFIISDSPVYSGEDAGRKMATDQRRRLTAVLGRKPADLPGGEGFLVESNLLRQLEEAGFTVEVHSVARPLGRLKRLARRLLRPNRRDEAKFPVFVATKTVQR